MCGVTSVKGVVETVSERVSKEDITGEMYYETLTGSIGNLAPSKLHSGYGFSYEVNGKYKMIGMRITLVYLLLLRHNTHLQTKD